MTTYAKQAAGIRGTTERVIRDALIAVRETQRTIQKAIIKQNSRPTQFQLQELEQTADVTQDLIGQLKRLTNARFKQLDSRPKISQIIAALKLAAKTAHEEVDRLKIFTGSITKFKQLLSEVTKLVSGLVGLAI